MADQFDQEDPFKKYGGSAVADPDDPFKKYGGVQSAAPVKKKEPTASEFSVSLLQKATGTAGPSSPALPKLPKQKKEIDQKELEDDPVGTVTKLVYSEAEPIPGYRDLSRPVAATTAVSQQTLLPEAREKKQQEITRTETSKPEYSLTFKEADKAVKEVKDYYQKSTNNAIAHLMKSTGIGDPDIFYSDAHQKIVEQRLRPGNQTDRLAYERVQEAKAAYNAIQEGGTLEDVAISFAAKRNPQVAKQIEKLQKSGVYAPQNIGDILAGKQPEELKKLPRQAFDESTLGKYMFEAYTNPAFLQELERNPELLKQYQQEMPMLAQRYPDFGRKLYGDVISQKMEDMGINNAILNVVTKDEFDSVVNQAIADGDIEPYMKSFIDKEIRPRVGLRNFGAQIIGRPTVRTTGLLENTLEGGVTGLTNIAKGTYELTGARNLMTSKQEQLKGDLAAEDSYVGVQPKGIVHEITTSGGQFLGQSLSIGGGGGIFKALGAVKNINKAVALSGGLQAYANYIPEARKKFPGEEIKQRGYASILAVTEMATENILKERKVVEGLMGKMKPSVLNTIKDFTEKRITAEAAKNSLEEAIKKSLIGTKYLGRAMAENTAEELAAKIADQATTGVFTGVPLSQTVDGQELWDTGRQALLGSVFIGGLAARADIKRSKGITAKTIYDMAENADYWKTQIQETGKQDEQLEKEVADKIKNLDYAQKIYTEIQGTGMDENQKIKFLITELEKKVAKDKADAITSDALKKKEKEIIKEAEQVQEDLLSGKDDGSIEGDESSKVSFTEEQQVLKDALPKISVGLFKDIAEQAAKSPESATQLLKEIADQVHGDELGNARQQQVDMYGNEVVDMAEKMFPKEPEVENPEVALSKQQQDISSPQKQTEYGQRQRDETEGRKDVLTPGTEQQVAEQSAPAASKKLSDKIRSLKIDISKMGDGGAQSNILGVPAALWNTSMDIIATAIDAGMSAADAIRRGLNHIQKNHRGQWDKKSFNDQVMKELGVRGITVNGEDLIVKDADKEFAETVNGFYSDLEQQVLDVKGSEGSPDSWLKVIGKSDEAKWTGLSEYLQSLPKDKKVSKKDIQQFLKDNRIKVVEVVKGGRTEDLNKALDERTRLLEPAYDVFERNKDLAGDANKDLPATWYRFIGQLAASNRISDAQILVEIQAAEESATNAINKIEFETKFSQYQLEGQKENYKEVLVTIPEVRSGKVIYQVIDENGNPYGVGAYDIKSANLVAERMNGTVVKKHEKAFSSSHFDEPNILVHLRMNTRTDAEGKKVLFLEEVQSDWGQKGKKEGFKETRDELKPQLDKISNELQNKYGIHTVLGGANHFHFEIFKNGKWEWVDSGANFDVPDVKARKLMDDYYNLMLKTEKTTASAPFVTETASWTKLGLKVALKEAVKQGADKIAWTTGEQQNDRYDLSKQVDRIDVEKVEGQKDLFFVDITMPNGEVNYLEVENGKVRNDKSVFQNQKLEDIVGKDIAEKILNGESQTIKGEGLKVGGKGMKGFYGSPSEGKLGIIGEVAKSLFKQEPGIVEIFVKGGHNAYGDISKDELKSIGEKSPLSTQHSISITPELKQEVETGLPLFKDIKGRGKEIADLLRKGKIKPSGLQSNIAGIPVALWNAAIDTIAAAIEGGASLAQAIKKAIDQHKLRDQKDFNQNEFIAKLEDATGEKFTDEAPPAEPPKEEKKSVYVQRPGTELSHRGLQDVANEFSLPDVKTRDRKSDIDLLQEARETVDDWAEKGQYAKNIESLIQEAEQGGVLTDKERVIMEQHLANLTEEARQLDPRTPEWDKKFKEIVRLKNAGEKTRSEAGAALRIPTFNMGPRTIIDEMAEEAQSAGVDQLTDNQKQIVQREYDNEQRLIEELKQKVAKLEEENEQLRAGENISKERKRSRKGKKTDAQYKEERKKILDDIKAKWAKSKGDTQVTVLPYANQLIAIAPDVKKLVTSLLDQGITELSDIIDNIHDAVSPIIPDVTKKDIRAIIAGEYNEKKPTRNQLAAQVKDLQDEAALLQKLEELESGEEPKSEKKKIERNRKITDLRKQIKEHDATKLAERKKNIKAQIEKISKQIESGDFSTPVKKPKIKLDREGQELERQLINIRKERMVRRLKNEYAKRTLWQVGMDKVAEVANIPRAIMASTDFSAPLNQAIVATIAHPSMAKDAAMQMFKSAFSQKEFDSWFYGLKDDPRYELMKELKLKISDPHSPFLTAREEAFMSGYAEQIPVAGRLIKGSERAYVQYLNKMRVDLFNRFIDRFEEQGKTYDNSKKLYEKTARYINNITGAGNLGKMEQFAPILSGLLFSPRLMASRLNLLNPVYFASLPNELKKQYAYDMGKFLGLGSMILTLFYLYGKTQDDDDEDKVTVETDPRSSDFAKIKQGNTRWNIWGGFQPYVRLGSQLATGQRKSANTGLVQDLSGEGAFGTTPLDQSASFLRGKLAPVPSSVIDLLSGRNIVGEKVTLKSEAQEWVTPLGIGGVIDGWKERGVMSMVSVGLPSVFGIGTQTYGERKQNIPEKLRINNKEVVLTDEQKKELDKFVSDNTKRKLDKVRGLKEYKDLDREQQVALETQVKRASLAEGKEWLEKKYKDKWPKETRAERDARVKKEREKKKLMRKLEE